MRVVTAPDPLGIVDGEITCFLAGGITGCPDWQSKVIENLEIHDKTFPEQLDGLVVLNPRRKNFPIDDPDAAMEQITWEFNGLQKMDLFSMYFTSGPSDQPICMYELGRNVCRMMQRFPNDYPERILISCDPEYRRAQDVKIQTILAFAEKGNLWKPDLIEKADPLMHAYQIIRQFKIAKITKERK